MGVYSGPDTSESGLVLYYDINTGIKNATGNISTNLIQNGNFVNGAVSPQ
jgi:hypothetical protein